MYIFNKEFLKENIVVHYCVFLSGLFHSNIIDGKKEYLKLWVLPGKADTYFSKRLLNKWLVCEISWNKSFGESVPLILRKVHSFLNQRLNLTDSKPNSLFET